MADLEFYRLSMTGAEADGGIRTGMEAGATSGVLLGDGNGGVTAATPGRDFGFPLLTGNGPPTGNTAANIGQHYFDMQATQAPYEYICVGLNANGFIWIVFGDTGDGFKISGYFASLEALEAAIEAGTVAAPTAGTAYGVGEAAPYDVYVWDAVNEDWVNNGPLGGAGGGGSVTGIPPHGDAGQVLKKLSDADYDVGWGEAVPDGSVTNAKIADGTVTAAKISSGAVTAAKIAANAVTSDKIAPGAVGATQIASDAIDTANIKDGAITQEKFAEGIEFGVTIVKLWENASPTSAFAAQTISIVGLSNYDWYAVEYLYGSSGGNANYSFLAINEIGKNTILNQMSSAADAFYARNCDYSEDALTFADGKRSTLLLTSPSTENNYVIPKIIYGIKGVS